MNYTSLIAFKNLVHDPVMKKTFEATELKEGTTFIDYMKISYLDGRSSGHDTHLYASGLIFFDGKVSKYEYEMCDVSVKEFMEGIKEIPFIYDGRTVVEDENSTIKLETLFCSTDYAVPLFPEIEDIKPIKRVIQSMEYEKMKFLYSEERQSHEESEEIEIGGMQM